VSIGDRPGRHDPVPADWDQLREPSATDVPPGSTRPDRSLDPPPVVSLVAGAWADLVTVLAVCTGCLLALVALGYGAPLTALPWAAGLAGLWWVVAAATLVVVRHGTPGMLMAGLEFDGTIPRRRVPWVVLSALILWSTFGLPSAIGRTGWLLRLSAGVAVIPSAQRPD